MKGSMAYELHISFPEAAFGTSVEVPTIDGRAKIKIPPGTQSGKVFRLKGKGFTDAAGKRGDLKVTLAVDLPGDDGQLRAFAEGWSGGGNPRAALGV